MNRQQRKARLKAARQHQKETRKAANAEPKAEAAAAKAGLKEAREAVAESRELNDDEARAMLVRAACLLDDVIGATREALAAVPDEWKHEAAAWLMAERATPGPDDGRDHRKLPRRGPDPVITLMKVGMQAASLLKRVIAKTNPELGKVPKVA